MTDNVLRTASAILNMSIADEPWLDIGYGRRPKHGVFFNQYFRAKWRRRLEDALLREIVSILTAVYRLAGVVGQRDLDLVTELYVDGNTGGLFRTFGFSSRTDAIAYFGDAIREYHEAEPSEWSGILTRRIRITRLPDHGLSAKLMVGSVRFTMNAARMVLVLRQQQGERQGQDR